MKRNRKVELVFRRRNEESPLSVGGDEFPLGYLLEQDELEKLTADDLRGALSVGDIFIIKKPNGNYTAIQGGLDCRCFMRPGEIKQRYAGSFKVVRVETETVLSQGVKSPIKPI